MSLSQKFDLLDVDIILLIYVKWTILHISQYTISNLVMLSTTPSLLPASLNLYPPSLGMLFKTNINNRMFLPIDYICFAVYVLVIIRQGNYDFVFLMTGIFH